MLMFSPSTEVIVHSPSTEDETESNHTHVPVEITPMMAKADRIETLLSFNIAYLKKRHSTMSASIGVFYIKSKPRQATNKRPPRIFSMAEARFICSENLLMIVIPCKNNGF
jgi:hypothetical protein